MRGEPLSVLRCPIAFADSPHLQQLFGWIYCWYHGMNDRAAEIMERNAPSILKAILSADQQRMDEKIDLEPDDHPWKESNAKISRGARFHFDEEVFEEYGVEMLAATSFKMNCNNGRVILTQLYAYQRPPFVSAGVERRHCELDVSLPQLKTACLRAFIELEHRAGRSADLREFDLNSFNVEGINFQGCKMRAAQFRQLLQLKTEFDFRNLQLIDTVGLADADFTHCMLDKALALQLIGMGGDRAMVLTKYLKTAQFLGGNKIDLDGFDLSGVEIRYTGRQLEGVVTYPDQSNYLCESALQNRSNGAGTVREIPNWCHPAEQRYSKPAIFQERAMQIPGYVHNYAMTTRVLKEGLQKKVTGETLPDLDTSCFKSYPRLHGVANFFYHCWLSYGRGIDVESYRLFTNQKSSILKAILKASSHPDKTERIQIQSSLGEMDEFDLIFNSKEKTVTVNKVFWRLPPKVDSNAYVYSATEVWDQLSLEGFKKDCLRAYIENEHENGALADLSDIDLSQYDTRGIAFDKTKISAHSFQHLAQGRCISLIGSEVVGRIADPHIDCTNLKLDKAITLQLMDAGADKSKVLDAYLTTQHELRSAVIDLAGFDTRGIFLKKPNAQQVDTGNNNSTQPDVTERIRRRFLIVDENMIKAMLDENGVMKNPPQSISVAPAFVGLARDLESRLAAEQPLPLKLSLDLTLNEGHVQLRTPAGSRAEDWTVFDIDNSKTIRSLERDFFVEMLRYEDHVNCHAPWLDTELNKTGLKNQELLADARHYEDDWPIDVAVKFVNRLPCNRNLKIELARFLSGLTNEPLSAPFQRYIAPPDGFQIIFRIAPEDLNWFDNSAPVEPQAVQPDLLSAQSHDGGAVSATGVIRVQPALSDPRADRLYQLSHRKDTDPAQRIVVL